MTRSRVSVDTRRLRNLENALRNGSIPSDVLVPLAERTHEHINENWSGVVPPRSAPGDPPAIDTGELARSIEIVELSKKHVRLQSDAEHAPMLEYGTTKMEERPFMLPAAEQTAAEADKINFQIITDSYL